MSPRRTRDRLSLGKRRRFEAMDVLERRGQMHAGELAAALGVPSARVRWIMEGRMPYYQPALSPARLRWVAVARGRVRLYRITRDGRRAVNEERLRRWEDARARIA